MELQLNDKFNQAEAVSDHQLVLIVRSRPFNLPFCQHTTAINHPNSTHHPVI